MFSRFFLSTRTSLLFQRPNCTVSTSGSATTEAQIQAELAEAAVEGMVTTRRQSHVSPEADLKDVSDIETPRAHAKKRKTGDGTDATPGDLSVKRRRKSSASGTIIVATTVKASGTRTPPLASRGFDKTSDGTLESDSLEDMERKTKGAANGDKRSMEQGCETKGPRPAASASPAIYTEKDAQRLQQPVAVMIESKPVDKVYLEDEARNKQTSSRKKACFTKASPVHLAATVGSVEDVINKSIASSREGDKKIAGHEVDSPPAEQSKNRPFSPGQVLNREAQAGKGSTGTPKTRQKALTTKGSRSNWGRHLDEAGSTRALNGEHGASMMEPSVSTPKAIHKRFASDEPDPPLLQRPNAQEQSEAHHEEDDDENVVVEDSDDDAPEKLTGSAGLEQVRATAIEAARAVVKQEAVTKEKRKARDSKLKTQAKSASKRKSHHRETIPENEPKAASERSNGTASNQHKAFTYSSFAAKGPLPALLPDELLAIEPVARPPTPPTEPEARLISISKKRKFLDADPKPPKDVKRGPISVRVLESQRQLLPPRASKTSKALKEAWLVGRRGASGACVVQRRKLGGGFVRK